MRGSCSGRAIRTAILRVSETPSSRGPREIICETCGSCWPSRKRQIPKLENRKLRIVAAEHREELRAQVFGKVAPHHLSRSLPVTLAAEGGFQWSSGDRSFPASCVRVYRDAWSRSPDRYVLHPLWLHEL